LAKQVRPTGRFHLSTEARALRGGVTASCAAFSAEPTPVRQAPMSQPDEQPLGRTATWITRRPLTSYCALCFAISWGLLISFGPLCARGVAMPFLDFF